MTPTVAAILAEAAQWGVELQARGGKLRYRPRGRMTPGLADRLKAYKAELLALLRTADAEPEQLAGSDAGLWKPEEIELLAKVSGPIRATVERIKTAFADTGAPTDHRPTHRPHRIAVTQTHLTVLLAAHFSTLLLKR